MSILRPIIHRLAVIKLPWPRVLRKPRMNLELPSLDLAYRSPGRYILGLVLLGTFFIMAGGLFDITEIPIAFGSDQYGQPMLITSQTNGQFLIESLVAGVLFAVGAGGIYLIRNTTNNEDSRLITSTLILGVVLLLVGVIAARLILDWKLS
ncbi:MAG: hypothetical protein ACFFBD_16625 [Candidatus Hodarchaeota archaeon]